MTKENKFLILITAIPLLIIFLAFFNPDYGGLVRKSIPVFAIVSIPYCLSVRDPRNGLILFLLEASLLEGPWKNFSYGMSLKWLVYIIRDLLLYATFLNFLKSKKRLLSRDVLRQHPPFTGIILIYVLNIIIQILNPYNFNHTSAIAGSRMFWEMLPLYWMGFYLMREKRSFKILFMLCLLCGFLNSVTTILQYVWGKAKVSLICEGYSVMIFKWGRGLGKTLRPPGLGPDMGFGGMYIAQTITMLITLFILKASEKQKKGPLLLAGLIALGIINLAGLIASASRSAMVLSFILLIVFIFARKELIRKRPLKIFIFLVLLFSLIMPYLFNSFKMAAKRYETVKSPVVLLRTIAETEKDRWEQSFVLPFRYSVKFFLGNGLGKVGPGAGLFSEGKVGQINAENTINLSLAEIGTIGTLLWILFHIVIIKRGFHNFIHIKDPELKWYVAVPFTYMISALTFWQFNQLIVFPQNAAFWFMSGILMGAAYIKDL